MGGPNDSVSSNKSATSAGKKNPPDEQKWHPGRQLCYHWKREHTFLADQVDLKTIAFNTQFHLEIEHCDMDRKEESMSVRPSTKGVCACCAALATGRPGLLIAARVLRWRLLTLQAAPSGPHLAALPIDELLRIIQLAAVPMSAWLT